LIGGYAGKILRVNLSRRKISTEVLSESWARKYIGGYGTAGKILYDEVPAWADAFDPENRLIFSTGPVSGTGVPTAGRHCVVTKSPLTGFFGDASAGGFWGAELKSSGYDSIVFNGRSSKPVLLWIDDVATELVDAQPYWGMDARTADRAIRKDLGEAGARVAVIGQAGENLVRFAGIPNDEANRIAARCGVGAVMGYMNLKAVAVKGERRVHIERPDLLRSVASEITRFVTSDPHVKSFTKAGTMLYFDLNWEIGDVPVCNLSRSDFGGPGDPGVQKLAYPDGYGKIIAGKRTCHVCPVSCRRVASYPASDKGEIEGPEYETVASFGPNCGIDSIRTIAEASDLCNIYGLDTISTGSTIAFAMECYENGLIDKADTGGVELTFGNADALIDTVHRIAHREGFGNILAEGSRRASRIIGNGAEYYAMQVKGLELAMHDPRAFQGGGLHFACTPTGGRHTEGLTLGHELVKTRPLLGIPVALDRFSTQGKARLVKIVEDWTAFISAAGWCLFTDDANAYPTEKSFLLAYEAVTGIAFTIEQALTIGERIFNLKKCFNIKHGATRNDDTLPKRLLIEKGKAGNIVKLDEMLGEYYQARGWNPNSGTPTPERLSCLGLD